MERTGERITSSLDWSIKPVERTKYEEIFSSLGPEDHKLSGNKVKPFMMNSKLPLETLGKIWNLSDIDQDGFLDKDEFVVVMHLVYKALENIPVPPTLPPDLIPHSKRQKSLYGDIQLPALPDLCGALSNSTPITDVTLKNALNNPVAPWVVSVSEKVKYNEIFQSLDQDYDGYVLGGDVKGVFLQSGLPQTQLARIWNLCDLSGSGKLNSEQFALAMHIIYETLQGGEIPTELKPDMVPPSLRSQPDGLMASTGETFQSTGTKELNTLTDEVKELQKTKHQLEEDVAQKDSQIKTYQTEIKTLQTEMNSLTLTIKQLEKQKAEAVKCLEDLNNQAEEMKIQIQEQETSFKDQEIFLNAKICELNDLHQEETSLQQQITDGRNGLRSMSKTVEMTQLEVIRTKENIEQLHQQELKMNKAIAQFQTAIKEGKLEVVDTDFLKNKPVNLTEMDGQQLMSEEDPFGKLEISFHNTEDPFEVFGISSAKEEYLNIDGTKENIKDVFLESSNSFEKVDDPFKHDFFGTNNLPVETDDAGFDQFSNDPFDSEDPFNENPFSSSRVAAEAISLDPFGEDPFKDDFSRPSEKDNDKDDPFGRFFINSGPTDSLDIFDLNSSSSSITTDSKQHPNPFGTDLFSLSSGSMEPESLIPALPPRKSKAPPPRPAPPKHSVSTSVTTASTQQADIRNSSFTPTSIFQDADYMGVLSDPFDSEEKPSKNITSSQLDLFDPFATGSDPFSNSTDAQDELASFADFDKINPLKELSP